MVARKRTTFKPRIDLLRSLTADALKARFQFNQEGIDFITNFICDFIDPPTTRNYSFQAHVKVMVTLRYFLTGRLQLFSEGNFGH